jgi:hypothetical protein
MITTLLERDFAEALGLREEHIRSLRKAHLTEGLHWKKEGRDIVMSEAGQEKIRAVLELEKTPQKKDGAEGSPVAQGDAQGVSDPVPAVVTLWVVSKPQNPRVLWCSDVEPTLWVEKKPPALLTVRVRSSENFRPRMALRARPCPVRPNTFDLEGRCPRFPGRY